MKILIAINSLVQGGAQKFSINLAEELVVRGHDVTFLTFYPEESDFFDIPEGVKVLRFINPFHDNNRQIKVAIPGFRKLQIRLKRVFWRIQDLLSIRKLIKDSEADITIAIERYTGILLGLIHPKKKPLVISERVHPDYHRLPKSIEKFQEFVYRKKNVHIHAQSFSIARDIKTKIDKLIAVIPNIVTPPTTERNHLPQEIKYVTALGRFDFQKGYDLLLEAWANVPSSIRLGWTLRIFGDNDRSHYQNIADILGISDSVQLLGPTKSVPEILAASEIYVMTSRYEGFPNALAEAMAIGIPCLVTDTPSAVRELTSNGNLAVLCDFNVSSVSSSLIKLMSDSNLRFELGQAAKVVVEHYSPIVITDTWLEYLKFVLSTPTEEKFAKCPICDQKSVMVEFKMRTQILQELNKNWDIIYSDNSHSLPYVVTRYRCTNCGTSHFNTLEGDEDFYNACHLSTSYQRKDNWDYVRIYESKLSNSKLNDTSILDVGSGFSRFIDLLPEPAKNLEVLEIDEHIVSNMLGKVRSAHKNFDSVIGKYDLIMVSHFLEHVNNPRHFVSSLQQYLNPKGVVAITVPDASFNESQDSVLDWPPHHTYRFTQSSLDYLMQENGYVRLETHVKSSLNNGTNFDFCSTFGFLSD